MVTDYRGQVEYAGVGVPQMVTAWAHVQDGEVITSVRFVVEVDVERGPILFGMSAHRETRLPRDESQDGAPFGPSPTPVLVSDALKAMARIAPLRSFAEAAVAEATSRRVSDALSGRPPTALEAIADVLSAHDSAVIDETFHALRPRRRARLTDEFLTQLAEVVRGAAQGHVYDAVRKWDQANSGLGPDSDDPNDAKINMWIRKARERKILGPTTRGKAGENT